MDKKTLRENENTIPEHTIFQITDHMQTVFTDIILHPCLMMSEKMIETIRLYEPSIRVEQIILTEQEIETVGIYYIPTLEKLDVLTPNSRVASDKSTLEYIEIDAAKAKGKAIFQIESNEKSYVLMHLDLVESLLRRKVIGIGLKEVDIKGG